MSKVSTKMVTVGSQSHHSFSETMQDRVLTFTDVFGFDPQGMSLQGFHRNDYDEEGFDIFGVDV